LTQIKYGFAKSHIESKGLKFISFGSGTEMGLEGYFLVFEDKDGSGRAMEVPKGASFGDIKGLINRKIEEIDMSRIFDAAEFAKNAHGEQKRKYTGDPYITHTEDVARRVYEYTHDVDLTVATLLHDVVEDTSITIEEIQSNFGATVAGIVSELTDEFTHEKYPDINRKERKRLEHERLGRASNGAKIIKMFDIENNAESILPRDPSFGEVYMGEIDSLLNELKDADPVLEARVRESIARGEETPSRSILDVLGDTKTLFSSIDRMNYIRQGDPIGFNYSTAFVARERFDLPSMERLSRGGSDRDVYYLGDNKVIKVAKSARGLYQNQAEGNGFLVDEGIIPEVFETGLNYVVAEKVDSPDTAVKNLIADLKPFNSRDFEERDETLDYVLEKHGLSAVWNYDVLWGDFKKLRNWGSKDGKPIHLDAGTFLGQDLVDTYFGKKNLNDKDFREIYDRSRAAKKEFRDTDKATMYSRQGDIRQALAIISDQGVKNAVDKVLIWDLLKVPEWVRSAQEQVAIRYVIKYGDRLPPSLLKKIKNLTLTKEFRNIEEKADETDKTNRRRIRRRRDTVLGDLGGGGNLSQISEERVQEYGNILVARREETQTTTSSFLDGLYGRILRPHQVDAINLGIDRFDSGFKGIIVADGAGSGKTLIALGLAKTYEDVFGTDFDIPVLIVTNSKDIYEDSFVGNAGMLDLKTDYVTSPSEIAEGIPVTTYNNISKFEDKTVGLLILDESHNLKNVAAQKTISGSILIQNARNVAALSATPIDKPEHLRYIASVLRVPFDDMLKELGVRKGRWGFRTKGVAGRLRDMFRELTKQGFMVKREVSLKNVDIAQYPIELSTKDLQQYETAEQEFNSRMEEVPPNRRGILKASGLQGLRRFLEPFKIPAALELMQQELDAGRQVVIFADRVNDTRVAGMESDGTLLSLERRLTGLGIPFSRLYASNKDAPQDIVKFQNGTNKVLIATVTSGGTGINLDDAVGDAPRSMIILSAPFSSIGMIQAFGRINRLNTQSRAKVFMLITDTIVDKWNMGVILRKLRTLGAAVEGDYQGIAEELTDIIDLDEPAIEPKPFKISPSLYSQPDFISVNGNILPREEDPLAWKNRYGIDPGVLMDVLGDIPELDDLIENRDLYSAAISDYIQATQKDSKISSTQREDVIRRAEKLRDSLNTLELPTEDQLISLQTEGVFVPARPFVKPFDRDRLIIFKNIDGSVMGVHVELSHEDLPKEYTQKKTENVWSVYDPDGKIIPGSQSISKSESRENAELLLAASGKIGRDILMDGAGFSDFALEYGLGISEARDYLENVAFASNPNDPKLHCISDVLPLVSPVC